MQNRYMSGNMYGRFAEVEELEEAYHRIELGGGDTKACGMPIISDGKKLLVSGPEENCIIMGGSGSKKTRLLVLPTVMNIAHFGNSLVINDPKGEIYGFTSGLLKKKGYDIRVLNFRQPLKGDAYNPLAIGARLYQEGEKGRAIQFFMSFADCLYKGLEKKDDPFWTETSADYFTALAMILSQELPAEDVTLENLYNLHVDGLVRTTGSTVLKDYLNIVNKDSRVWQFASATVEAPSDTKSSILSVFSSGLSKLIIDDQVSDMLSGESSFDIRDVEKRKTAIFIVSRDETSIHNTIISALIDQWYTELIAAAEENGGVLKRPVDFILDEFGNLAKVNDINAKITAARSRRIRFMLVVQSLEQISHVYGKDVAKIILGNCQNWAYLNSSDPELNKLLSERCGNYVTEYTRETKKLFPIERIQYLEKEKGEVLLLLNRQRPFVTYLPDVSKYICYTDKREIDCPIRTMKIQNGFNIGAKVAEIQNNRMQSLFAKLETTMDELKIPDDIKLFEAEDFDVEEETE